MDIDQRLHELEWERERWSRFPIPADLTGKRVLDIGAWDGWFSFEAERRGAAVTSVDCQEQANYLELHRKLGSKADYRNLDLFELPWVDLGKFDIVFCLGVLYHLRHPLWGLEILCGLSTELVIVETFVTDGANWQDHVNDIPAWSSTRPPSSTAISTTGTARRSVAFWRCAARPDSRGWN